jgi:rhodanese-related sulfurtransferase
MTWFPIRSHISEITPADLESKDEMRNYLKWLLLAALVLGLTAACSSAKDNSPTQQVSETSTGGYRTLDIDTFAGILENEAQNYTIVNVHIPYAGEIEGTDVHIAYNDVEALTAALPDKNQPIILYCRSGSMSEQASQSLIDLGYTQVWDVPGGMYAWQSSGRSLIQKSDS